MNKKTFKQWFALMVMLLVGTTASQAQSLTIDDFQIKPGESKTVALKIDKGTLDAIYSVQADIAFSEGLSLEGEPELINGVLAGGSIASNTLSSGATRISALSLSGKTFTAEEVINITVKAADTFESGTITLSKIEFAITAQGQTFNPESSTCNVTKEEEEQPGGEETSYTITFKDSGNSSDSSTKVTTKDAIISEGASYVSEIATADNIYNARTGRGIKFGTSSKTGTLELTLAKAVKPTKITFDAMYYNTSETSITVNGKAFTELTGTVTTYTVEYDGNTEVTSITLATPAKRAYVTGVTVYYKSEGGDNPPAPETVADPKANLETGTYEGPQTVELTCTTEGASIYYTLDGTAPTAESTLYTEALTISETTTLKAIAIKGEQQSAVVEYTYTIVPVAERATFDFDAYEGPYSSNSSSDGDITENLVIVEGDVTMTITPSTSNTPNRYWSSNPKMRMYGGRMILEAAEGKAIVKVEITNGRWNAGNTFNGETASTGTWEGNSTNVVLKVAANTQMNKVVVTLAEANENTTTYDDPDAEDPEVTAAREELLGEIETATGLLDSETATDEQKAALQEAIDAAQAVADNADATKEELEAALGALKTAEENYLTPTGISTIEASRQNAPVYNLQGQRVQQVRQGLYIVDGKKFFVR